jgi:hypothetical protein
MDCLLREEACKIGIWVRAYRGICYGISEKGGRGSGRVDGFKKKNECVQLQRLESGNGLSREQGCSIISGRASVFSSSLDEGSQYYIACM